MSPQRAAQPKYRHYKPKNLGVVRIAGRDHYLGDFNSPESWEKYHRLIAEWLASARQAPDAPSSATAEASPASEKPDLTISQVIHAYRQFAATYYTKNGQPTKELTEMKFAARPVRKLYGNTLAKDFGPLALKSVRTHMVKEEDLSRGVVNNRINRIKRIFKWAVSEELIPTSIYEALRTVDGLKFGRTDARETEPVKPVAWENVDPVLKCSSPLVRIMVLVQWHTGMRPCEVVMMRKCDIEFNDDVWIYEPADHKNRWRGHTRSIVLGPKSQRLLKPLIEDCDTNEEYLFSPRKSEYERNKERRRNRKTPMTPSQSKRNAKKSPKREKRTHYDVDSYRRAIKYAIRKANKTRGAAEKIPEWYPLQLRHSRATEIRRQFGLEAAQVMLGHKRADVTEVYAERNLEQAVSIAKQIG